VLARLDHHHDRVWLEKVLAVVAVTLVGGLITLTSPGDWEAAGLDAYALLAAMMGLGAWLPLLCRRRWSAVGELGREGDDLVFRRKSRTRRFPIWRIRGVRVAPGERGASVVMALDGEGVLAAALDDMEDARRLAGEVGSKEAGENVMVQGHHLELAALALRVATTLFSLAYYLTRGRSPHDSNFAAGAMIFGVVLLLVHLASHRRWPLGAVVATRGYTSTLRAHFRAHARAASNEAPPPLPHARVVDLDEPPGAWLTRMRREMADPDAYRGAAQAIRAKLEHALGSAEVPLRDRALALRVLAAGEPGEVRRRIAEGPALAEEEEAWVEAVALAEDDGGALAKVARRPPDFRA